jgi:hypothetical protein
MCINLLVFIPCVAFLKKFIFIAHDWSTSQLLPRRALQVQAEAGFDPKHNGKWDAHMWTFTSGLAQSAIDSDVTNAL